MRLVKWLIGLVIAAAVIVVGGGYLYLRSTTPDYDGRLKAPVNAETAIIRDSYGVPYILADTETDAFLAVGFAMAQDRLFQMEMIRAAGTGRLAEILGADLVPVDRLFLALTSVNDLGAQYAALPQDLKNLLTAFTDGVNLFIAQDQLPIELKILGHLPNPWRPEDCLTVATIMAWDLNLAWMNDLIATAVADKLGADQVAEFFPGYPKNAPTIVPKGGFMSAGAREFMATALAARNFLGLGFAAGSNNWVLSGEKTTTGQPILCNDMHLGFSQPPIWWECGIVAGSIAVKGLMVPGAPLVLAGNTPDFAWGLTNVMADDADFFIEKAKPDNPSLYLADGKWVPFKEVTRTIKVKDGQPIRQVYRITRNGVIINDLKTPAPIGDRLLAMRWSGQDWLGQAAKAFYMMLQAEDWESFNEAVDQFGCPGQNFVYADREGNIGWRMGFKIPKRKGGYNPLLPVEGSSGKNGWDGYLPFSQQPFLYNPPRGYIITANNKTIGPEYPHYISQYWAGPERFSRIEAMIKSKAKFAPEEMRTLHMDVKSLTAEYFLPYILGAFDNQPPTPRQKAALDLLAKWNLYLHAQSPAAAVFEMTMSHLYRETVKDELGDLTKPWLGSHYIANRAMKRWLKQDSAVFDDKTTDEIEDRAAIIRRSLDLALDELTAIFETDDMAAWRWGKFHQLEFRHPFHGRLGPLDRLIDLGPYPVGGGMFTVNPLQYKLAGDFRAVSGASMRHVFDLSNLERSRAVITTGQSGHALSPHYRDQVRLWLEGKTHPISLDPSRIEALGQYRFTLEP